MKNIKSEKGISLIALAITIMIVVLLASIAINKGTTNINEAKEEILKTEANIVKNAVLQQYAKYKETKDESYLLGSPISDAEITNILGRPYEANFEEEIFFELSKIDTEKMGIENAEDTYIVNYNGDVIIKYVSNGEIKYYCDVNKSSGEVTIS